MIENNTLQSVREVMCTSCRSIWLEFNKTKSDVKNLVCKYCGCHCVKDTGQHLK